MYIRLKKQLFEDGSGYSLVPVREEDIESIRVWRNGQMEHLRQKEPITKEAQNQYFKEKVFPGFKEEYPRQMLFSFLLQGKCIGYGALTYIDWKTGRTELSFIVDPERAKQPKVYECDFLHYIKLIASVAFDDLGLNEIFAETYPIRPLHLALLEKGGFKEVKRLKNNAFKDGQWHDSIFHELRKDKVANKNEK